MEIKIATLNLCLGLKNKRIDVENLLIRNDMKVLCLQEMEVESGIDTETLQLKNSQCELEINSLKSRIAIYVSNSISYRRIHNLESCFG